MSMPVLLIASCSCHRSLYNVNRCAMGREVTRKLPYGLETRQSTIPLCQYYCEIPVGPVWVCCRRRRRCSVIAISIHCMNNKELRYGRLTIHILQKVQDSPHSSIDVSLTAFELCKSHPPAIALSLGVGIWGSAGVASLERDGCS